jgi:putative cell wall-binding protein
MSKRSLRRSWSVVAVFAVVAVIGLVGASSSSADANFGFTRLQGTDRYDTARDVAAKTFGTSDAVVLASGENYPDALAASFAAGVPGVPILLTKKESLPAPTQTALTALKATKVTIAGGTGAISTAVEQDLKSKGLSVTRVAGDNRYATAVALAKSGGPTAVGKTGGPVPAAVPTAIVVSGEPGVFADALAAGPAAFASKLPVLLTPQAGLAPETKTFLKDADYGIKAVLIVGGTTVVSQSVEDEIKALGITVTRIAGANRSETATKVADYEIASLAFVKTHVDLARGDAFADALAAAAHSGKAKAPLLLTQDSTTLGAATKTWLGAHKADLKDGHIMGGTGAVSDAVEKEAETAAGNTSGTTSSTSSSSTTTTTSPLGGNTDQPGPPTFYSAAISFTTTPPPTTSKIVVTYSEAVVCTSVSAADFAITITDTDTANDKVTSGSTEIPAASPGDDPVVIAQCGNGSSDTSSKTVTLTPQTIITPRQEGKVSLKSNALVIDLGSNPQTAADFVSWVGPKFKSALFSNNGGNKISVTYDELLDCTSVSQSPDPVMTDYAVTNASNSTALQMTQVSCLGDTVTISLQAAPPQGASVKVALKDDNAKVTNQRGELQPTDDTLTFVAVP